MQIEVATLIAYIQCSVVKRKGKDGRNRKLVEAYRETGQPRNRTVRNLETFAGWKQADQASNIMAITALCRPTWAHKNRRFCSNTGHR